VAPYSTLYEGLPPLYGARIALSMKAYLHCTAACACDARSDEIGVVFLFFRRASLKMANKHILYSYRLSHYKLMRVLRRVTLYVDGLDRLQLSSLRCAIEESCREKSLVGYRNNDE